MSPSLPALLGRPALDAPDPGAQAGIPLQIDLTAGVPAVIALDADRRLVLAVPLGVATAVLTADPTAVVLDTADPPSRRRGACPCGGNIRNSAWRHQWGKSAGWRFPVFRISRRSADRAALRRALLHAARLKKELSHKVRDAIDVDPVKLL